MEDNKKRKLYDNLTNDGYKLGTYEEFDSNMQKDDISRRFYDNMTSDGYKLGSYDDFKGIVKNAEEQQEPVDYSAGQTTNFKVSEDMLGSSDGAVKDTVPIVQLTDGSYMSEDAYNKAQNRHKELTEKYGEGYVEFKDGSAMSRKDYDKMMETDAALTRQYGDGYVTLQGGQHMSRKDYDAKMAEYNKAKAEYYDKYDKLSAEERKAIDIYSMLEKNGKNDNNVNDIPDAFKSMCDKTAGKKGSDDSYVKAWWALSPEERKKWVDAAINDVMAKRTPKIPFKAGEEEMPSIVDLLEENRVRMENLTRAEMDEYGNRYIDAVDSSKHSPEMIQRSYIDRMGGMYGTAEEAMQFNKNLDDLEERQRQSAEMFKNTLPTQLDNAISDVERTIDARWNDNVSLTAEPGADYWLTRASGNGAILTAYDMLRDAKEIVEAANKQGWASNAVGGFTDAVSSMKVWSMGVQDLFNTAELMAISKKMKSGEELTDDEKTLLNAVSMLKAVNDVFDDKISMWYKAGKVTGEMLPYMLQMAMNPTASGAKAVGKAITDKLSTGLVRTIEKETGRVSVKAVSDLTAQQMLKAGVRNIGARVVGEIAQNSLSSAGLAASLQAAQVAADAAQRYNGEARFVYDADGNVQFGGFTDGDTALKAIAKAYGAMTVENFSEGVGEWLKPIFSAGGGALAKALTKANMGFLPNFVNAMNNTQFAKAMDKFFKVTKYDGPISEFIEEKISPLMDYALGIDRDSVMEGYLDKKENMELLLSVSILGVVSGTVNMMHYPFALKKAKADLENATKKAQMLYSEGEWAALKATIDEMPADYFSDFMDKHQVQPEDDATERAKKRALLEYVVRTSNYRAVNAIDAFDKASGKTDWVVEQMTKAEQEGYEAQGVKKQQLSAEMDAAEELLGYYLPEGTIAEEFASKYGTTAEEQMRNIDEDESLTDVTKSALKQYITSSVKYNAMVTAAQEDIDAAVRRARAEAKKTDNNGERVRVTTTDEREGYVVQGNTQTDTAVQVLYDGEETPTMVGSKSVMSETRTSTEEDATAAENAAREAATSEVAASIDIPEPVNGFQQQFQPEDRVLVNVGGQQVSGTVIRMNNDNVNMPAYQVQLDAPVNGNNVAVVPADQTFSEEDAQRIEAMREQARQNMKAATEVAQPVSTTQEGQVQGGGVEQPVAATQQQYEMLKNEDGSTNYVGSGVDATLQQMESLDEEDKAPFVNANKNAAQERFNKAQEAVAEVERTKPAIGTDIEAYNTAKQAWQQQRDAAMNELNDAKKALDFWNEVECRMNSNDAVNVPAEEDLDELAKFLGVKPELLKAIKALCDSIGVNVEFANYLTTEDGKSMTNGEFDPRTNTIRLSKLQILNGTAIEFIFGHEMTHGLKQKSPELYQKYVDAVRKAMGLAFMRNFNRMLPQYISIATDIASQRGMNGKAVMDAFKNAVRTGEPIDWTAEGKDEATKAAFQYVFDYVTEEVVSDNAGNMLSDSTFQKEMGISMDKSMLDTVLDTVSSLINLVKKISGDYRAYEEKVSEIESAFKDAAKAWKEMADNAGEAGEATAKDIKKEMDGAGLVMEGGAVMSNEAQELKHEEGYQTPNEMTDTDMALKYSYATKDDWMLDYLKGKPSKRMKVIADMVNNWYEMAAADDAVHDYMSYGQYPGGDLNKDGKGPLRSNVEYVYTFDLDTTCPRTFQYLMYADRIEKRIHRPLSQREAVILIETMRAYGQEIPCVYCYAENKRQALKNYYLNFISARNGVLNAKDEQEAFAAMYGKNNKGELTDAAEKVYEKWRGDNALNGYRPSMQMLFDHYNQARDIVLTWLDDAMEAGKITTKLSDSKLTGMLCEEFGIPTGRSVAQEYKGMKTSISNIVNEWRYDVIESTGRDVPKDKMHKNHKEMSGMMGFNLNALALWDEMVKYGKSASSAKNAVRYFPYTSQLKDVPNKKKDYINAMGGLRMHSTNDFRIDYVGDYIQLIADMDKYGWKGHTYTKSPLFVKIFGNTGYRINMSIAAYDINGEVKENHDEGHFWDKAKALREKFPNAGTMFMTTSSAQLQYALDADWVDMIIPFHASGLPKEIWYNMRRWEDATNSQNEEFYNAEDKKRRLREAGVQFKRSISAEALNELYDATFETIKVYDNTKAMKEELKGAGQSIKSGITYEELAMQYKDFFGHKCKTKGERIKPHFLPGETYKGGNVIPGHGNDVKKYFELCEQYGVRPRFQGIEVMVDGEMTDVINHPGYIKLIKETARTDSEQTEVEFNLDEPNEALGINPDTGSAYTPLEYAMYELRDHAKRGGYQYESSEQFGIVEEFMTNVIQHERETGEERPLDYISDDARAMWFVQNDAANFAAMDANEQLGDIPYHPAKKYSVVDTDSENFKRWFVDSKVVNKYGDPLVMSHNTDKDFWTFDKERIGTGQGQAFLGQGFNFSRGGSSVYGKNEMKVYLSIKNPMTSNKVTITRTQLRNIINELNSKSTERIEDSWGTMNDCITALMEYAEGDMDLYATIGMTYYGDAKDVISVFEKHGFDGTIEYNADGEIRNAVAFEPTQIKSATDNNGNFDPENADIRYSVVPGEKTLYGSHNISEENLRKVIKKGGFANPSVAVSDIEKGTHEGFGEITLLLPSEKIDSRTGDNGGTWTDDTWTPVYPKTRRMFTEEGGKKFAGMLDEIGVDEGIRKELMNEERQMVYGSEPDFHWLYLKSKNIDTTEYNHPDLISYWKEIFRQYNSAGKLIDALRNGNNEPLAENVKRAIESYLVVKLQNEHPELYTEGDINDIDSIITANRSNKKKIREVYGSEDGKYGDDIIKEAFNNKLKAYKSKKHGVDAKGTMQNAYYVTTEKGLENDYKRWLDDMLDTFGSKDEIINGADRNGNAKYMPNTLQNASNVMNSGKQKGNNTLGGWGAFIAEFAKNMGTLDEIRDNKGKIIGSKEERADVTKKFIELATLLHSKNSELGLWDGTASKTLAKIVKSSNIESACNKYGIELNEQEMTDLKEFAKKMKSGVALFFETKFNRPVMMSEFVSAVVPKKTSADIIDALEKSGLSVYKYDPNKEGNRSEVIKKAASRKGVKFSVAADESLLDKAERIYAENKDTVIEPEYGDAPVKYSVVTDPDELERLNNDPEGYVEMYCSMAKICGNYYSPMASKEPKEVTFKNGKKGIRNVLANPMQIGDWDKAARKTLDDPLVRIDPEDPTGERWQYRLIKPNGKDMWVAYNPYEHSTASPLNDQFTSAYDRPELVIVKVRIPKSDLNSKEKAPGAKDAVGTIKWHEGPVASLLDGTKDQRYVSLSNYRQIIEEVPVEKEAKEIAEILNKYGIAMPINVVRPQLREELVKLGVKFGPIKGQVRDADVPKLNKILADINGTDGPEGGKKYSIIGEIGAAAMDEADGGDRIERLKKAVEMLNKGVSIKDIRRLTGWEYGEGKKAWRFEIKDGEIIKNPKLKRYEWTTDDGQHRYEYTGKLEDVYDNPDLYKAYPELRNIEIEINPYSEDGELGFYSEATDLIKVVSNYMRWVEPEHSERYKELDKKLEEYFDNAPSDASPEELDEMLEKWQSSKEGKELEMLSEEESGHFEAGFPDYERNGSARRVLIHEIQHAIQRIEGFPKGGSWKRSDYKRLAGEVEARNAEKRSGMSDKEREEKTLSETEDVPSEDQIIRYSISEAKEEAEKYGYGAPYQGSKNLQVNDLMDVLPGGKRFVDLFSGGGAMTHGALLSGKYGNVLMNDIDGAGQQLFLDGIDGKYEGYDKTYDKETFKDIAHTPEAYIWSHRNNGRSFQGDRAESRVARVNALQALKPVRDMITTSNEDYRNVAIKDGDVLYADIPYADTDTQAYNRFDVKEFTDWAKGLDVPVYVSSKADSKLDGFTKILEKEYTSGGKKRAEGLFVQDKFADNGYGKKYSVSKEGKYIPDLKNYDNVLQEIKEKNVSLQKIPVRSFKASDGLWREGLNDYIVRLKSILNGKNKITYTESVVRNNRSDNSSVRYYSDFIQQKSKREVQGTNKTNIILPYDRGLIKDAISRAESEIKRRGYIEERLREKYDIGEDGSISLDNLRALFESVNSDKKNEALFDAVSHAIKNKNEGIYIADPSHGRAAGSFDVITGNVNYRMDNIVRNMSNGKAASVILHELIHRATKDLILQSRIPLYREVMRRDVFDAANNIRQIYDAVSKAFPEDKIGKRAYYGANSVDEMVAELANPEFREALRNIKWDKKEKRTLLDKLLGLIKKMLIGCIPNNKVSGNALADAEDALSTLLNNFSDANYDLSRSLYKTIGKFIDSINSEEKTGRQPGESLIDYAARIDAARKEGEKKYSVAVEESDPFYSNAARAVDGIKQEKATGEQWLAMLRKNGGLKAEEDKWMGLSDWLGGKKSVTKDEVLQYIAENSVKVEEVEYGGTIYKPSDELKEMGFWQDDENTWRNAYDSELVIRRENGKYYVDFAGSRSNREFDTYDEALEEAYTELDSVWGDLAYGTENNNVKTIHGTRLGYTTNGLTNKREIALTVPTIEPYNASDMIHFGDAGEGRAVAWLRFGDALTNDGQRVLVIDEVQSKRHQDGRENGYRSEDFIPYSEAKKLFYDYKDSIKEKYGISKERTVQLSDWMTYEENKEYVRLLDQMTSRMNDRSVPDAPFQKTWHELAMKRALRYAAENGYDAVAWTTGRQQSDRYNLANGPVYVDSIVVSHEDYDYQNNEWGDYNNAKETQPKFVRIRLSNEGDVDFNVSKDGTILDGEFKGRRLSEVVGSNIATKILSTPVEEYETTYQGDDFVFDEETGGKGMAGFYDRMLPSFMDKYGKKWGVKTHDIELDLPNERDRVMHAVDVTPEMRESVMKGQPMYSIAMDEYNGKVNHKEWMKENYMTRLRESWQDGMISLKVLADAVLKETGGDMKDYENFYNAFNQLSSRNTADMERFNKKFMGPLIDEISKIINGASGMRGKINAYTANNGRALKELTDYMIAKHGLERNEVFYDRDLNRWQEAHDKWEAGGMVGPEPQVPDKHDYSGLTALTGQTDYTAMTAAAQYIVDEYEKIHDTTELWNRVNAATKDTLKKQYESGMISKANYEKVRDMFQWYIPLRGFDEKTAEDAYQYYNSSNSFSPTLKAATGRESLADNPFVFISNMADSAIMQGNKNVAKQHLLDFAMNHPSDVMSVSEMWYEKDASGEWVPVTANIPSDATPEEVKKAVDQFEEWMQQRKDNGEDVSKTKAGLNSKYIIESKADSKQHQITLKRLGKDYIIYINGDPRAAQAINGLIGSNKDGYGVIRRINRWLSAAYTSQNPSFVLSNLVRDSIFGLTMIGVKESPAYAYKYMKNYVESVASMMGLMYGHSKDSNVRTDIRKYYEEFVANGGQTGFAYLKGRDEVKKDIMKELGHPDWNNTRKIGQTIIMNGNGIVPIVKAVSKAADLASEWAENIVRFATYMTSREMGRGIERSVSDAKEITLNFNRTGSGEGVAGLAKSIYLFLNPAIQAIHKVCEAAVDHPIKMSVAAAFYAALGYVLPKLMLGDGDDDKDTYFGVPDFSRRNNVVIPLGKEDYLMIPLPPEMRALYSVGEILYSLEQGHQSGDEAEQIASQMMSFVPLDFTSNGGDIVTNLLPDAFKPVEQVMKNKKFYGAPIYKEGYGSADKEKPGYTKAFRGTSSQLVEATKWLNEQGGGDEYTSGGYWYDWNPAILEHLVQGYTGGKGKTLVQLASLPKAIMEGVKNPKEVPVIDRFWGKIDDPDERKAIERDFRNWTKDIEAISMRMKGYEKKIEKGDTIGYAERRNYMANSGEVELKAAYDYYNKNDDNRKYRGIHSLKQDIKDYEEAGNMVYADSARQKMYNEMQQCIDLLNQLDIKRKEYMKHNRMPKLGEEK